VARTIRTGSSGPVWQDFGDGIAALIGLGDDAVGGQALIEAVGRFRPDQEGRPFHKGESN
jgi:hypothetical protein